MIHNRKELFEYIESDNDFLKPNNIKSCIVAGFAQYPVYQIRKYLKYLRKQEYYINTANGNKIKALAALYYERRKNILGARLGIEIGPNCFGKGLSIWHYGSVIVNTDAKIGDNCTLHGANCIGNNGKSQGVPTLGNNVDLGYGAVVIGDIVIADDVKIGANAVVIKSVMKKGSTVVGIPARPIGE